MICFAGSSWNPDLCVLQNEIASRSASVTGAMSSAEHINPSISGFPDDSLNMSFPARETVTTMLLAFLLGECGFVVVFFDMMYLLRYGVNKKMPNKSINRSLRPGYLGVSQTKEQTTLLL
jgi:hypothetical protein